MLECQRRRGNGAIRRKSRHKRARCAAERRAALLDRYVNVYRVSEAERSAAAAGGGGERESGGCKM